jgi:flagellar biosynthesis/type III secretory pathway protein FliH
VPTFVPWGQPRAWTAFSRPGLAVVPEPAPGARTEPGRPDAQPSDSAPDPTPPEPRPKLVEAEELLRARFEKADRERAAEHAAAMEALHTARAEAEAERDRFTTLAEELGQVRAALIQEMRGHTVDLVVLTAERIAGAALRTDPELLLGVIEDAIGSLGDEVTVTVSPDDEARVTAAMAGRPIRVVADIAVRAGCIVHSPSGRIDAALDTAVAALRASAEPWARG